jgi:hypothetical protein
MNQTEIQTEAQVQIDNAAAADLALDSDLLGDIDVWTPEIDRLVSNVSRWVRMDSPGAAVYGPQRVGKTHACQFLHKTLPALFGGALAFLQRVMAQTGCRSYQHRDIEVLRDRLTDHLYEVAVASGSKRIVLMWDEAQNLERPQYGWMITMFNELEHRRLRPFFLLVGQPELRDITAAFRVAGSQQVIGRFFSHGHEFLGIADDELDVVLRALDSDDDESAGPRRFMSRQYAEGFQLQNLADPLATALGALRKKHQLVHSVRLPMQYLRSAVLNALIRIIRGEINHRQVSPVTMLECLKETGFLNVVLVYAELMSDK